ncbi:MAG: sulfite exporter TauE/SafE family protein [Acidimicrobiaceae bacterium]|nr:sulfite exporter TauE/SafE family protein [Acidimicrobiaceae bacterium]
MHLDPALVVASAVVGFAVGLTGVGGGALMTPMLVLLFGVAPSTAITSDLVAALVMKPFGVSVHLHRRTIHWPLVRYLCLGSVPAAVLGTWTLRQFGTSPGSEHLLQRILGVALILGAGALLARPLVPHVDTPAPLTLRRTLLVLTGVLGGFMVGLTSVGAGSLIVVLLLAIYPRMANDRLVGTDLAQSLPLTAAATVGTLLFGHVHVGVTLDIVIGSVPAVILGARLSSRSFARHLRPIIAGTVLLSGLKYVGTPLLALGVSALILLPASIGFVIWSIRRSPVALEVP